jgi:hypothetical protein
MIDGKRRAYLREYFTTACILHGKITDLEEIKAYIVGAYVEKGLLEMILTCTRDWGDFLTWWTVDPWLVAGTRW